jgi:hypothetical protein
VSSEYGVSHEPHLRKQLYFRSDLMQNLVTAVRSGLLLVAMSLIAAANLLGAAANGSLRGVVTDPSGARVVKATVTVQATEPQPQSRVEPTGRILFLNLLPVHMSSRLPRRASL